MPGDTGTVWASRALCTYSRALASSGSPLEVWLQEDVDGQEVGDARGRALPRPLFEYDRVWGVGQGKDEDAVVHGLSLGQEALYYFHVAIRVSEVGHVPLAWEEVIRRGRDFASEHSDDRRKERWALVAF
jgi:hypothetical protein